MLTIPITRNETVYGWLYMAFELLLLPSLLHGVNGSLAVPFTEAALNFIYFIVNFISIVWIFRRFLGRSLRKVRQHPAYFCQAVILGLAAYYACKALLDVLIPWIHPGFRNLNDEGILSMARNNRFLMTVGTVLLVPTVEECLYRGLIFRRLCDVSPWAGYLVSMLAFALIHIIGFVGVYSPMDLLVCLLQYLPAGLCLAWCYKKADTIYASILVHSLINLRSLMLMR